MPRHTSRMSRQTAPARSCYARSSGQYKSHRVIDQQFALQLGGHGDVRDKVNQQAVVGHVIFQIQVRPVGAPEHTVRGTFHDRLANGITSRYAFCSPFSALGPVTESRSGQLTFDHTLLCSRMN